MDKCTFPHCGCTTPCVHIQEQGVVPLSNFLEKRHSCKHCGWDPDGHYCGHAESIKQTMFGRGLRAMRDPVVGKAEAVCGPDAKLWEKQDDK